jgi:hypothetical protein
MSHHRAFFFFFLVNSWGKLKKGAVLCRQIISWRFLENPSGDIKEAAGGPRMNLEE